jgi:acyl carrier protein
MREENVEEDLSEYIIALTGCDRDIEHDTRLTDLEVDSISLVKIFVFIEKHFGISLLNAGVTREQIETFGSLVKYIKQTM